MCKLTQKLVSVREHLLSRQEHKCKIEDVFLRV